MASLCWYICICLATTLDVCGHQFYKKSHDCYMYSLLQLERSSNTSESPPWFLHVVVSVFPDDSKCSSARQELADGIAGPTNNKNIDPEPYEEEREKTVTILIEPALSGE